MNDIQESPASELATAAQAADKPASPSRAKAKAKDPAASPDSVAALAAAGKVKIILEEHDEIPPTGQFFGVNGVGYLLVPGQVAEVPLAVLEVLNNAVRDKPVLEAGRVVGYKQALRFPYRRVS